MRRAAVLVLLLALCGVAEAQQKKPAPAPSPPRSAFPPPAFRITVATEAAYPPFNYLDRKGLPAGFEMEVAQEACQRIKAECEFVVYPWDDLVPGLLDKKFDVIMSSLEVTPERRKRLGLTRRYYLSPGAFVAHKGAPFDGPPSLLRGRKIGVQRDSMHADWVDKSFRRSAQIRRFPSVADALRALAADEIDAVFGDKVELWTWTQTPDAACCALIGQDIKDNQTLGVGVSAGLRREDVKLREALNKALGDMTGDGTLKKLNEKYFPFPLN
ncbi:MAG: transporter substrate-binding domain-containing protein [Enhydrobacter sp.]|nr:MAG: transporter substrate-binding domain-containing protein [Enhydrobacter sp.]